MGGPSAAVLARAVASALLAHWPVQSTVDEVAALAAAMPQLAAFNAAVESGAQETTNAGDSLSASEIYYPLQAVRRCPLRYANFVGVLDCRRAPSVVDGALLRDATLVSDADDAVLGHRRREAAADATDGSSAPAADAAVPYDPVPHVPPPEPWVPAQERTDAAAPLVFRVDSVDWQSMTPNPLDSARHAAVSDTLAAFGHWSYEKSGHAWVVDVVAHVGDFVVAVKVHTNTTAAAAAHSPSSSSSAPLPPFGIYNQQRAGIQSFAARHQCGVTCRALRLPPLVVMGVDTA